MKTKWVPALDIVKRWSRFIPVRLWPGRFHELFNPKKQLAPLEQNGTLQAVREKQKIEVDHLVDKCLPCKTIQDLERTIRASAPMSAALYYDRIVMGTLFLDHMLPVKQNRPCEIPEDWETFVLLLLHQEWFA